MSKIKVLQQVLDPSGAGGVSAEFRALKNSSLTDKYEFESMILMDIHPGISIKDIVFYYKVIRENKPDIIHIRGAAIDGLNAVIAAKLARNGKILVAVHGMYSDLVYISNIKRWISKNIIERLIYTLSDGISCVCENAEKREYFDRYRNKMLPFVYNRIPDYNLGKHKDYRKEIRCMYNISPNAIVALYVGRMTREKGLIVLKDSLMKLSKRWPDNFVFLFVGDGDYKEQLENELKEINRYVVFAGNQTKVEQYYAAADFFVMPSLHENHSISLLESVAAELPAIATDCGGNTEIVDNNKTGIIIPTNDECALRESIVSMCDRRLREEYKRNIQNADYSRFSNEKIDAALGKVYERIMEEKHARKSIHNI